MSIKKVLDFPVQLKIDIKKNIDGYQGNLCDGYSSYMNSGINSIKEIYDLKSIPLGEQDKNKILRQLNQFSGVDIFYWSADNSRLEPFICVNWSEHKISKDFWIITATFEKQNNGQCSDFVSFINKEEINYYLDSSYDFVQNNIREQKPCFLNKEYLAQEKIATDSTVNLIAQIESIIGFEMALIATLDNRWKNLSDLVSESLVVNYYKEAIPLNVVFWLPIINNFFSDISTIPLLYEAYDLLKNRDNKWLLARESTIKSEKIATEYNNYIKWYHRPNISSLPKTKRGYLKIEPTLSLTEKQRDFLLNATKSQALRGINNASISLVTDIIYDIYNVSAWYLTANNGSGIFSVENSRIFIKVFTNTVEIKLTGINGEKKSVEPFIDEWQQIDLLSFFLKETSIHEIEVTGGNALILCEHLISTNNTINNIFENRIILEFPDYYTNTFDNRLSLCLDLFLNSQRKRINAMPNKKYAFFGDSIGALETSNNKGDFSASAILSVAKTWFKNINNDKARNITMNYLSSLDKWFFENPTTMPTGVYSDYVGQLPQAFYGALRTDNAVYIPANLLQAAVYANLAGGDPAITFRIIVKCYVFLKTLYVDSGNMKGSFSKKMPFSTETGEYKTYFITWHALAIQALSLLLAKNDEITLPSCNALVL